MASLVPRRAARMISSGLGVPKSNPEADFCTLFPSECFSVRCIALIVIALVKIEPKDEGELALSGWGEDLTSRDHLGGE